MSMSINTNMISLIAQDNVSGTGSSLQQAMTRLSSGLRINSAADDSAGLAISQRMQAQINGLNIAAQNANNGISLAQTAEGALGQVSDMLQSMRELAVQASNATNTTSDLSNLDANVQSLKAEIQQVATQTQFNGTNLLDGSFTSQQFQVGANAGDTITVSQIANANLAQLGGTTNIATESVAASALTGYGTAIAAGGVTINGIDIGAIPASGSAAARASSLVSAINAVSGQSNVGASYDATTGQITLTSTASGGIVVAGTTNDATVAGFANGTTAGTATTGIANLNVQSFSSAQTAITQIDAALNSVNQDRANMGALENQFTNAVSEVQVTSQNLTAANGRIVDANFAQETANMSRAQILQQAGVAMVAQANQRPQEVLKLLPQ